MNTFDIEFVFLQPQRNHIRMGVLDMHRYSNYDPINEFQIIVMLQGMAA